MDKDMISELQKIGLNEYESKAFIALLNEDTLTAGKISKKADIPRPRTYDVLESLEDKGMCSIQPGRPTKYKANPLEEAVGNLKERKKKEHAEELEKIDKVKNKIQKELKKSRKTRKKSNENPHDFLWFLKNKEKLSSKIKKLIQGAKEEIVLATDSEDALEHIKEYGKEFQEAKNRGTNIRVITDDTDEIERAIEFAEVQKENHKHRFMTIDDHSILFLTPKKDKDKEVGAWVKSPFFTKGLKHKFKE
ncbi:MAG: TrmB family transcriptional regulator [archaeon]